jgi:uncharacterized membrane protein YphA (DoxX/SURF4 family)
MSSHIASIHAHEGVRKNLKITQASIARRLLTAARILTGLSFLTFGLDGFLHFIPQPTSGIPEGALAFGAALHQTGYMLPLIKGTEVVSALLLLSNRFVPLALLLLAPVVVNIVAFHVFLAPDGIGIAVVHAPFVAFLAWGQRTAFSTVLTPRERPTA